MGKIKELEKIHNNYENTLQKIINKLNVSVKEVYGQTYYFVDNVWMNKGALSLYIKTLRKNEQNRYL